jgi:hypothetical protein
MRRSRYTVGRAGAAATVRATGKGLPCLFILVPLLMARTLRERALTLGAAVPCALLGYALIELPLQTVSA